MPDEPDQPHVRRPRYKGKHPREFSQKYKELNPELYPADIEKVLARGATPAGSHRSIMLRECLERLDPKPGETAIDATLGHGGHAAEILRALRPGGRLFGLDRDPLEIAKTEARLRAEGFAEESFRALRMNFADLAQALEEGRIPRVDMVLADLGVSSMQIDDPARGFSFKGLGPLDMRMDPSQGRSAADFLRDVKEARLREIIEEYSDESEAPVIARVLTQRRGKIATTKDLADAVRAALQGRLNPEDVTRKIIRRVFQALRIEVNGEFSALEKLLAALPAVLLSGGRVAILCFHSGERERVEGSFREGLAEGIYSSISEEGQKPSPEEVRDNTRSGSARLWWAVRA